MTQYVTAVAGRGALYHELQELFDADYPISTLHHFLATLPGMLREGGLLAARSDYSHHEL